MRSLGPSGMFPGTGGSSGIPGTPGTCGTAGGEGAVGAVGWLLPCVVDSCFMLKKGIEGSEGIAGGEEEEGEDPDRMGGIVKPGTIGGDVTGACPEDG